MSVRIVQGDAVARLRELPADSVHCCVTSPPYFALRSYLPDGHELKSFELGSEPTPEEWCARLVEVFREVRRVLRPDGVCFVNCGDSYASSGIQGPNSGLAALADRHAPRANPRNPNRDDTGGVPRSTKTVPPGLKPKDLIGAPWLLAFALRADGWWLRSDTIWSKPNPMPESVSGWQWEQHRVRDPETCKLVECPGCPKCEPNDGLVLARNAWRPTKAHEYVFMLGKSETYFCDQEAVREAHSEGTHGWTAKHNAPESDKYSIVGNGHDGKRAAPNPAGRNQRSVWTIATEPNPLQHFASYPTELVRRCILAGTSAKGCCPECGAPWARVVERVDQGWDGSKYGERMAIAKGRSAIGFAERSTLGSPNGKLTGKTELLGWRPTCTCPPADPIPATVLDPFGGSGTTGLVADQLGRDAILIELSPEYAEMAERRITGARARRAIGDAKPAPVLPGQGSLF